MLHYARVDEDGNPQIDLTNTTPEQWAALNSLQTTKKRSYDNKGALIGEEVRVKVTKEDKLRALELLARVEGMLAPTEHRVTVDVGDKLLAARARLLSAASSVTKDEDS